VSAIEPSQSASSACADVDSGVANLLPEVLPEVLPDGTMAETVQSELPVQSLPVHPGQLLRAARERLGLSLNDIAQATKFGVRQIEALEQNDVQRLPPATFVRGMLRGYARRVELDPVPLLAAYEAHGQSRLPVLPQAVVRPVTFPEGHNRSTRNSLLWSLALLVAMLAVLLEWQFGDALWGTHPVPAAATSADAAATAGPNGELSLPLSPTPQLLQDGAASDSERSLVPAGAANAASVVTGTGIPGRSMLQLEFQGRSWVEVRERDGRVIFSQDNPAGSRSSVEGVLPLTLTIGNAAGVKLIWLDKPVDLKPHLGVAGVAQLVLQ
jgi:cytoskeleton protein RodZ